MSETTIIETPTPTVDLPVPPAPALPFEGALDRKTLRALGIALSTLVDEAKLRFQFDDANAIIHSRVVDPAHVAMADVSIAADAIKGLRTGAFEVGLDLGRLKEIVGDFESGTLELKVDPAETNRAIYTQGDTVLRQVLTDPSGMPDPKVPALKQTARATVPIADALRLFKHASHITERVILQVDADRLELRAEGDHDTATWKSKKNTASATEPTRSIYSLDYLTKILKAVGGDKGFADSVTFEFATDYPTRILAEGDGVRAVYLLAPRIEEDEPASSEAGTEPAGEETSDEAAGPEDDGAAAEPEQAGEPVDDTAPEAVPDAKGPTPVSDLYDGHVHRATVEATLIEVRPLSGLVLRCPTCHAAVQGSVCNVHGRVKGEPTLGLKAVLDDGTGAVNALFDQRQTEALLGKTLEACVEEAREAMCTDVVEHELKAKLLARLLRVTGSVHVEAYGPTLHVEDAQVLQRDLAKAAEQLVAELEDAEEVEGDLGAPDAVSHGEDASVDGA